MSNLPAQSMVWACSGGAASCSKMASILLPTTSNLSPSRGALPLPSKSLRLVKTMGLSLVLFIKLADQPDRIGAKIAKILHARAAPPSKNRRREHCHNYLITDRWV